MSPIDGIRDIGYASANLNRDRTGGRMKKRSIVIGSHKTSISLEDIFWTAVQQIARERAMTRSQLIAAIHATCKGGNLSSAVRVFVLDHYRYIVAGTSGAQRTINATEEYMPMAIGIIHV
jgi:predicted DNA-binding ribbon-helix-helix protein